MADNASHLLCHVQRQIAAIAPNQASDAALLEQFLQTRDEAAFTTLVDRHGPMVLRLCRRVLADAHAAEDCFQATFLVLARKAASIRHGEALTAWLHGVAYRIARKARAAAIRWPHVAGGPEELPADPRPDPLAELTARELLLAVDEEVRRLPEVYRLPVILCCLEGRTREEAADLLGWTAGSVKGRLERGRARLHAGLVRRGLSLSAALTAVGVTSQVSAMPAITLAAKVSERVVALAEIGTPGGGLMARFAVGLLVLILGLAGAGVASHLTGSKTGSPTEKELEPEPKLGKAQQEAHPLPAGALVRIGAVRFWSGSTIECVAFSPDGKTLAVGNTDCAIRLWNVATGKEVGVFRGHRSAVQSVAFSPDGKTLASRSGGAAFADNSIRIWNVASGKEIGSFGAHAQEPWTGTLSHSGSASWAFWIAFSPDGKTLASGAGDIRGGDNVIRLWDVDTEKELRQCRGHRELIRCFAFSPDGKTLASGSKDQSVRLWEAATGKEIYRLEGHKDVIRSVAFAADGRTLVSVGGGTIRLWDPALGKELQSLVAKEARSVTFTDAQTLAWGDDRGAVRLMDLTSGKEIRRLGQHSYGISHLCLSHDGKTLASVGNGLDYAVHLCDPKTGQQLSPGPEGHRAPLAALVYSPDGRSLISTGWDGTIRFWNPNTGKALRRFEEGAYALAISPNGKQLAAIGNEVRLLEAQSGKVLRQLKNPGSGWFTSAVFATDGKTLLTGGNRFENGWKGTACLWDVGTGKELRAFRGHQNNVLSVAMAPDGKTIVSGGEDSTVRLWETATGKVLHVLRGHPGYVESVAIAADGKTLAAAGGPTITLYDVATGQEFRKMQGLDGTKVIAFSPDGETLASGGYEGGKDPLVRLWKVASGKEIRSWSGHRNAIETLAFAPDGSSLASGGRDSHILIWALR